MASVFVEFANTPHLSAVSDAFCRSSDLDPFWLNASVQIFVVPASAAVEVTPICGLSLNMPSRK